MRPGKYLEPPEGGFGPWSTSVTDRVRGAWRPLAVPRLPRERSFTDAPLTTGGGSSPEPGACDQLDSSCGQARRRRVTPRFCADLAIASVWQSDRRAPRWSMGPAPPKRSPDPRGRGGESARREVPSLAGPKSRMPPTDRCRLQPKAAISNGVRTGRRVLEIRGSSTDRTGSGGRLSGQADRGSQQFVRH
jgi:hypothetical protein